MTHLSSSDHYELLQEAVDNYKNRDGSIKIVCGDGVIYVEASHFKFASIFWMKLLEEIPQSECHILIAPDISVQNIQHLGKHKRI